MTVDATSVFSTDGIRAKMVVSEDHIDDGAADPDAILAQTDEASPNNDALPTPLAPKPAAAMIVTLAKPVMGRF